jgi:phage gp46-like protein
MDFAITIDNQTGLGAMTFVKAENIMNNIYLSLKVKRGSFFYDPTFGSRLYLLDREKNTEIKRQLAVDYAKEALQWMIASGKAQTVDVYAERDRQRNLDRMKLLVEVTPVNADQPVAFSIFVDVI